MGKQLRKKRTAQTKSDDNIYTTGQSGTERILVGLCIIISLFFAAYLSILYFGHQTVPNSDFPDFFNTGKSLFSFQLPHSFKRLPVLGVLQVGLSYLMGGHHPGLTAGWVLNSILYTATGVFLYLVGKKVLGSAGIWFALLVLINPMAIKWLCHPIAETTFVFFIVMTFYFMLRPTRWAYLPAMLTSMVRYEGAILILLCFCIDFFTGKNWKSRLFSFLRAGLAALPLALWMFGMFATRKPGISAGALPYIRNYDVGRQMVIGKFANYVWSNGVSSLFILPGEEQMQVVTLISKIVLVVALLLALGFCIGKRQWKILTLLGFLGLFFVLHAIRTYTLPRYGVPVIWVTVLSAWYGLKSVWDLVVQKRWIPPVVQGLLQVIVAIAAVVWVCSLFQYLPKMALMSRDSAFVPMITMLAVVIVLAVRLFWPGQFSAKKLLVSIVIFCVMGLMVASNQFGLVRKVGNGSLDREFKYLADWYYENAQEGEILATTMPHVVRLFLPEDRAQSLRVMQRIRGKTPQEFIETCYKKNVTYIAWDSRIGLTPKNTYYKRWKMARVNFLRTPRNYGTAEGTVKFIKQIQNEDYRYRFIYIYKLEKPVSNRPSVQSTPSPSD